MNRDQLIRKLNEPSRVLADELFPRFPAWTEFAEVYCGPDRDDGMSTGGLTVHIPSPVARRDHFLQVMVQGDTFLTWYVFGDPRRPWEGLFIFAPGEEREAAIEAVEWMADIVEGRVVLVEQRVGFLPWSRATTLCPRRRDELTEDQKRRVVSWDGAFDTPGPVGDGQG
jgi:hypothetical protein